MTDLHLDRLETAEAYLKRFKGMKTIPSVAVRLVSMIEDDKSSLQEFEALIKMDPTLVLRLLKLVNSAYFSLRTKIKTISEAVVYIGMDNLRNMIALDAVKNLFLDHPVRGRFSRERLWLHSAVTSICCQMISERIFVQKGEDAFLCGLLHDIGLIVEDQADPERFFEFCGSFDPDIHQMIRRETMMMGTAHPVVGHCLTREWGLDPDVCRAVRLHHTPTEDLLPESLGGILQISEHLMNRMGYDAFPDIPGPLSPLLLEHIKENIMGYRAIVDDLPQEIQKAREIYSLKDTAHG